MGQGLQNDSFRNQIFQLWFQNSSVQLSETKLSKWTAILSIWFIAIFEFCASTSTYKMQCFLSRLKYFHCYRFRFVSGPVIIFLANHIVDKWVREKIMFAVQKSIALIGFIAFLVCIDAIPYCFVIGSIQYLV